VKCECMKTRPMGLLLEVTRITRKINRQWTTLKSREFSGLGSAYHGFGSRSGVYRYAITEIRKPKVQLSSYTNPICHCIWSFIKKGCKH